MLKTEEDIKKFISTLPTTPDGNSNTNLYQYQGFWYHSYYLELVISAQTNFNPNPNTTILCSYPKTGTTWLKALSFAISNRTHNHNSPSQSPLLTELPHNCVPFIELLDHNQQNPQSQLLSTHIPYTSYEELKSETVKWVKKLAEFLGCGFSMEEEEDGSMEKVIEMCGNTPFAVPNSSFYRKGEVGDWRNCISGEMADRLDRIMEDKLGGFGFKLWSSHASMAETTT
ncbi:Cytosolic sulfotransferase 4 [Linum perenne]